MSNANVRPSVYLNLKRDHFDENDAIFNTFSNKVAKRLVDIVKTSAQNTGYTESPPPKGCLDHVGTVLLFFSWVLTTYVFVVTEFAAIGVGKRAIRSNNVKISGRSSLDENRTQVRVTAMAPESALTTAPRARRPPQASWPPCLDPCVEPQRNSDENRGRLCSSGPATCGIKT
ncbi:hypothetical protein Zmor_026022 [Zophobas morio]|uniref:Uncharacterized protein n=1 Tax=Zophobas morio TaxID=2755281 RepID=A0AA38HSR9_9CUCU|nr:hypothetical protein Zmor_026022 [Zophobas morio]